MKRFKDKEETERKSYLHMLVCLAHLMIMRFLGISQN